VKACPSCHREHADHYHHCLDCGAPLNPRPLWLRLVIGSVILALVAGMILLWRQPAVPRVHSALGDDRIQASAASSRENGGKAQPATSPKLQPDTGNATVVSPPAPSVAGAGNDLKPGAGSDPIGEAPPNRSTADLGDKSSADRPTPDCLEPESQKKAPAPRKRVTRASGGTSATVGDGVFRQDAIHTSEAQFNAALGSAVYSRYRDILARSVGEPAIAGKCTALVRIDLETAKTEILDIRGDANARGKALLCLAVRECSGLLPVPLELRKGTARYFDTEVSIDLRD